MTKRRSLSPHEADEIRRLSASGQTQSEIARTYGRTQSTISRIVNVAAHDDSHDLEIVECGGGITARVRKGHRNSALYCDVQLLVDQILAHPTHECILWPFAKSMQGYGLASYPGLKETQAHRVVCRLVHGDPPKNRPQVAHNCGVRDCVNPAHLRFASAKSNALDVALHGQTKANYGEENGNSSLSDSDIIDIRTLYAFGATQKNLGIAFQVRQGYVSKVVNKLFRKDLP